VHGDSVGQGGVRGVLIQMEAHVYSITERQHGYAVVSSVNIERRHDVTYEVQCRLETVFTHGTGRIHRDHDVRARLTCYDHTHTVLVRLQTAQQQCTALQISPLKASL